MHPILYIVSALSCILAASLPPYNIKYADKALCADAASTLMHYFADNGAFIGFNGPSCLYKLAKSPSVTIGEFKISPYDEAGEYVVPEAEQSGECSFTNWVVEDGSRRFKVNVLLGYRGMHLRCPNDDPNTPSIQIDLYFTLQDRI